MSLLPKLCLPKAVLDRRLTVRGFKGAYELGDELGSGVYGHVYLATNVDTKEEVAIKEVEVNLEINTEIKVQRLLDHQHVVPIIDVACNVNTTYIIMERADCDLIDYVEKHEALSIDEVKRLFAQIIYGLAHCHSRQVAHRDLKLENIFLDKHCNVKIGDFRLSADLSTCQPKGPCGTKEYMAPELSELSEEAKYDAYAADVWACGVMLYALLTGVDPVPYHAGELVIHGSVPYHARELVTCMLAVDPVERISITGIKKHLQEHSWVDTDVLACMRPAELTSSAHSHAHEKQRASQEGHCFPFLSIGTKMCKGMLLSAAKAICT